MESGDRISGQETKVRSHEVAGGRNYESGGQIRGRGQNSRDKNKGI